MNWKKACINKNKQCQEIQFMSSFFGVGPPVTQSLETTSDWNCLSWQESGSHTIMHSGDALIVLINIVYSWTRGGNFFSIPTSLRISHASCILAPHNCPSQLIHYTLIVIRGSRHGARDLLAYVPCYISTLWPHGKDNIRSRVSMYPRPSESRSSVE